jgi:hypothetical protein
MLQITPITKTTLLNNIIIQQILFPSERLLAVKRIRILCSSVCNSLSFHHGRYYYIQLHGSESLFRRSSAEGILCILWNLRVHFIIYMGSPLDRLLGQPLINHINRTLNTCISFVSQLFEKIFSSVAKLVRLVAFRT